MQKLLISLVKKSPHSPYFYLVCWIIWFTVLWLLSSRGPSDDKPPSIPHIDKVLHFGYFLGGAMFSTSLLISHKKFKLSSNLIILLALAIGAAVGALDEYHQSWIPGRFGNDPWDWLADCLGTLTGAAFTLWAWRKYK